MKTSKKIIPILLLALTLIILIIWIGISLSLTPELKAQSKEHNFTAKYFVAVSGSDVWMGELKWKKEKERF